MTSAATGCWESAGSNGELDPPVPAFMVMDTAETDERSIAVTTTDPRVRCRGRAVCPETSAELGRRGAAQKDRLLCSPVACVVLLRGALSVDEEKRDFRREAAVSGSSSNLSGDWNERTIPKLKLLRWV